MLDAPPQVHNHQKEEEEIKSGRIFFSRIQFQKTEDASNTSTAVADVTKGP